MEGGRAGKGPAPLAPRRPAHPTRTVRDEFLVEIGDGAGVADLLELNRLFLEYQKFFGEAQKLGKEILRQLDS